MKLQFPRPVMTYLIILFMIPNISYGKDTKSRTYFKAIKYGSNGYIDEPNNKMRDFAIAEILYDSESNVPIKITITSSNSKRKYIEEFNLHKVSNTELDDGTFDVSKFSKQVSIITSFKFNATKHAKIKNLYVSKVGDSIRISIDDINGRRRYEFSRFIEENSLESLLITEISKERPDLEIFSELTKSNMDINEKYDDVGYTLLHTASDNGHVDIINLLIIKGADVNSVDDFGATPLVYAAINDQIEAIEVLLRKGADVNFSDRDGYTALHHASDQGNNDMVNLLLDNGADISLLTREANMNPLFLAVRKDHQDVIETLLIRGLDINSKAIEGLTPLHIAIAKGNYDIVQYIISQGAEVNTLSDEGMSPLHFAAKYGHKEIVKLLFENGANKDLINKEGKKAVDIAKTEEIKSLIGIN